MYRIYLPVPLDIFVASSVDLEDGFRAATWPLEGRDLRRRITSKGSVRERTSSGKEGKKKRSSIRSRKRATEKKTLAPSTKRTEGVPDVWNGECVNWGRVLCPDLTPSLSVPLQDLRKTRTQFGIACKDQKTVGCIDRDGNIATERQLSVWRKRGDG